MPTKILTKPRILAHLAVLFVGLGLITFTIVKMWLWLFAMFYALSFIFGIASLVVNRRAGEVAVRKLDMIGYMEAALGMLPLVIAIVLVALLKIAG